VRRSFEEPDEQTWLAGGRVRVDVVHIGEMPVKRVSHAPGWRWSEHSGPEMNAERCPDTHVGLLLFGRLGVQLEDGSEFEAGAGEVVAIPPGHDAWVLGDEPAVLVQFDEGASAADRFGL
jgi:quercetin dioxygenase-like cupin family protein